MHRVTLERPAQWRFALSLFLVGFAFMVAANFLPSAMSPNVYGYIVYDTPAEIWASGFMAASGLVLYGLHINGRWYWSPVIRVAGYALLAFLFGIIAVSAVYSPDGLVLTIWSVLFFIPQSLLFLRISVADMRWRIAIGKP
jgi:hypothetical protein